MFKKTLLRSGHNVVSDDLTGQQMGGHSTHVQYNVTNGSTDGEYVKNTCCSILIVLSVAAL